MPLPYRRVRLSAEGSRSQSRPPRTISFWNADEGRRRRSHSDEHRRQRSQNIDRAATVTTLSPARTLLAHVVDYAGTFPPANLALDAVPWTYAREHARPDAWLLGRVVIGVLRLGPMTEKGAGWM